MPACKTELNPTLTKAHKFLNASSNQLSTSMATMQIPNDIGEALGYLREEEKVLAVRWGVTRVLAGRHAELSRKLTTFRKKYGSLTRFEKKLAVLVQRKDDFPIERDYSEWVNTLTALREIKAALRNLRAKSS